MLKNKINDISYLLGQERFQSLGVAFYRGADCCVLVSFSLFYRILAFPTEKIYPIRTPKLIILGL